MNETAAAPGRDIVTIGASAGGVEALMRLFAGLPSDLSAALFVVLHVPASGTSMLPQILERAGPLPVSHARDGERIELGRAYVAPPNYHLLIKDGHIRLSLGPRENRQRPAADPLFRTAARSFGRRVTGVVLSGSLDDGTAGLVAIRSRGGAAIVQEPSDALVDSMPRNALAAVRDASVLPVRQIGAELARLATIPVTEEEPPVTRELDLEARIAESDPAVHHLNDPVGTPSGLACPECGGSLWELRDGELIRYRCRVGHAFSPLSLQEEQADQLEGALWAALRNLEEQASLSRRMANNFESRGILRSATRFREQAEESLRRADLIRDVLFQIGSLAKAGLQTGNGDRPETRPPEAADRAVGRA